MRGAIKLRIIALHQPLLNPQIKPIAQPPPQGWGHHRGELARDRLKVHAERGAHVDEQALKQVCPRSQEEKSSSRGNPQLGTLEDSLIL